MKTGKPAITIMALFLAAIITAFCPPHAQAAEKAPAKTADGKQEKVTTVGLEEARRRARLLHETYVATLRTMHRYYFRDGEITIPSRAMEDVFYRIALREKIKANWIAVNAQAMSIDNKPETEFEKEAARVLRTGKDLHEEIKDGQYRRAGSVILFGGCIRCHKSNARSPVAGLILSMPIAAEEARD